MAQKILIPDELKENVNQVLNRYEQSEGQENLNEFLQKESEERERLQKEEQQKQQQAKEEQQKLQPTPNVAGYYQQLANYVEKIPEANNTQVIKDQLSKDGEPQYTYKADPDLADNDVKVTKNFQHTQSGNPGVFNSSSNPNDYSFSRAAPEGINGQPIPATNLTDQDKQDKANQINEIENKTFESMAKEHRLDLDYKKTQQEDDDKKTQHEFTSKDGKPISQMLHEGLRQEFFDKFDQNAQQDAKKNDRDAPEASAQQTDLPQPVQGNMQLKPSMRIAHEDKEQQQKEQAKAATAAERQNQDQSSSPSSTPTLKPQ